MVMSAERQTKGLGFVASLGTAIRVGLCKEVALELIKTWMKRSQGLEDQSPTAWVC